MGLRRPAAVHAAVIRAGVELFGDTLWACGCPACCHRGAPALLLAADHPRAGRGRGRADPRRAACDLASPWSAPHHADRRARPAVWLLVILCVMRALLRARRATGCGRPVSSGWRCTTSTPHPAAADVRGRRARRRARAGPAVAVAVGRARHRAGGRAAQPAVPGHPRLPAAGHGRALAEDKGDDARSADAVPAAVGPVFGRCGSRARGAVARPGGGRCARSRWRTRWCWSCCSSSPASRTTRSGCWPTCSPSARCRPSWRRAPAAGSWSAARP